MLYMVIVIKQKNTRHPFNSQTNILNSRESAVHKRKLSLTPKLAKQIVSPKSEAQRKNNFSFPWVENKHSLYMHFKNVKDTGGKRILPDKKEMLSRVEKKQTFSCFWSCASPDSFFLSFFFFFWLAAHSHKYVYYFLLAHNYTKNHLSNILGNPK